MIIANSNIQLYSDHNETTKTRSQESLSLWLNGGSVRTIENSGNSLGREALEIVAEKSVEVNISRSAMSFQADKAFLSPSPSTHSNSLSVIEALNVSMFQMLVESFIGHKIKLFKAEDLTGDTPVVDSISRKPDNQLSDTPDSNFESVGLIYNHYQSHYESESTRFSATGMVSTADGQIIEIDLQLGMSREFMSEVNLTVREGEALKDPLVINFGGTAAQLTQAKYSFDIDADGDPDQISFVSAQSGFLALDKNNDFIINNGSELFGALSGDGFADLAQYDDDNNGWIDEQDSIYSQLRIWSKDAAGNDSLMALGHQGVGAIYLGHIDTPFFIKDAANETQGLIRETGLFLNEDGTTGTVQQLDLKI